MPGTTSWRHSSSPAGRHWSRLSWWSPVAARSAQRGGAQEDQLRPSGTDADRRRAHRPTRSSSSWSSERAEAFELGDPSRYSVVGAGAPGAVHGRGRGAAGLPIRRRDGGGGDRDRGAAPHARRLVLRVRGVDAVGSRAPDGPVKTPPAGGSSATGRRQRTGPVGVPALRRAQPALRRAGAGEPDGRQPDDRPREGRARMSEGAQREAPSTPAGHRRPRGQDARGLTEGPPDARVRSRRSPTPRSALKGRPSGVGRGRPAASSSTAAPTATRAAPTSSGRSCTS